MRCGWLGPPPGGACPTCGSLGLATVLSDAVITLPAGAMPCPSCGNADEALQFRAWMRHYALIVFARTVRISGYGCPSCNRRRTALNMAITGLFGWWGLLSALIYAPRATYTNWRAIWAPPRLPRMWGAVYATGLADDLRSDYAAVDLQASWIAGSPLLGLSEDDLHTVFHASDLYETLRASKTSSREELRKAYVSQAKAHHPDLAANDPDATEHMIRLNQAWAVLRDDRLRAAYDWLLDHPAPTPHR